jgi:chemosensory pili system protein ChpA (sensor histidine kinase/response regulator)
MQDDLLRTRMVEFESLSDRLYRVVRQAAKETGKQVRLDIVGGSIEVDRGVLERMTAPSSTCCATAWRTASSAGRAPAAARTPPADHASPWPGRQRSGVEFRDDGAGLDLPASASAREPWGCWRPTSEPTDAELANLIFTPGSPPPPKSPNWQAAAWAWTWCAPR